MQEISVYNYIWFFMIYSFCGWIWESSYCSAKARKLINRGFLTGPYIPIYGCGALIVYILLYPYKDQLWLVYIGGVVFPTILEFLTSWIMEKLFDATWWDYKDEKYNIQGRICLKVSLFWGFFSVIMVEILHPLVIYIIGLIPVNIGRAVGGFFIFVFSIDFVNTAVGTFQVKDALEKMENVREDIYQFIEVHNLDDAYKELLPSKMLALMHERWEERKDYLSSMPITGSISEYKDEMEAKLSELVKHYEDYKSNTNRIVKRYIDAYPRLKSTKHNEVFTDLKSRFENIRKENK